MSRLASSSRDSSLRKALERRQEAAAGPVSTVDHPLPWWLPTTSAEHAAWLASPPPEPVAFEELDAHVKWPPGQPVLLTTGGHQHLMFVRLTSAWFAPRWLKPGLGWLAHPCELSTRDPRQDWAHAWVLQLALALLATPGDDRLAWLRGIDGETEPDLVDLLLEAQQELVARPPAYTPGPAPLPQPKPRRAWTTRELEALRIPKGAVEVVSCPFR
jgi:hypothetical protein